MRILIESLKRLYQEDKLSTKKIDELFNDGKITEEEKNFILNK